MSHQANATPRSNIAPAGSRPRCCVLGANGFLGRAVVRQLLRQGHHVSAVGRNEPCDDFHQIRTGELNWMIADVGQPGALLDVFERSDIVFHLATSTHPTLHLDDPIAEIQNSLIPLQHIIDQALQRNICKVVFPSSGGTVYVDQSSPRTENTPTDPKTPYAIFKLASECMLRSTSQRTGAFTVDVMRIANLYGPGQPKRPGQGVLPHWLDAIQAEQPLMIFGDGSSSRDYVHLDDAAYCLASSCDRMDQSDVFNVGTGVAVTLNELVSHLSKVARRELSVQHLPARSSDLQSVCLDSSKLLGKLPEFSWTPLLEGLHSCIEQDQNAGEEILR